MIWNMSVNMRIALAGTDGGVEIDVSEGTAAAFTADLVRDELPHNANPFIVLTDLAGDDTVLRRDAIISVLCDGKESG